MLTKTDTKIIKNLLKPFATKADLKNFATKDDLKPIKHDIAKIRKDMNTITGFFDKE